jgi:activator of 2-hydroxyglutaryl-CoA dehydratase
MVQALSNALGQDVMVSQNAQFTGALGAAIIASKQAA